MTSSAFETILDECLSRVQAGEPLEYCLEEYPQLAADLRPLLGLARSVRTLPLPPLHQRQVDAGMALMMSRVPAVSQRANLKPAGPSRLQQLVSNIFKPALTVGFVLTAMFVLGVWLYTLRDALPTDSSSTAVAAVTVEPGPDVAQVQELPVEVAILPPAIVIYEDAAEAAVETAEVSELPMPDIAAPSLPIPAATGAADTGPSTTGPAVGRGGLVGCSTAYFFTPAPESCPRFPAQTSTGAVQPFENGWMVWLPNGDLAGSALIYVLYDNGMYDVFVDSWLTGQPLGDDSLVVPAGLSQPIRGFGKIWREQPGVAIALGWATNGEFGYEITWQDEQPNDLEASRYVQLNETMLIQLSHSLQSGVWHSVTSP